MKEKAQLIVVLVTMFVGITSGVCVADEVDQGPLCSKWRDEHHREVVTLIQSYLKGAPFPKLCATIREIVRLEVLLGTCSKRKRDFYLDEVTTDDLRQIPAQILMRYLRDRGISMDARGFFEGRKITYVVGKE